MFPNLQGLAQWTESPTLIPGLTPLGDKFKGVLYFTEDDQLLMTYQEQQGVVCKHISSDDLRSAAMNISTDSGWIPEGVKRVGIFKSSQWFVYYRPALKEYLNILTGNEFITVKVPLPAMVNIVYGNNHWVFAVKGNKFNPGSVLHHFPVPNIGDKGMVCWGNVAHTHGDKPNKASNNIKAFLNSPFNNHSVDKKSKKYPDDVRKLLLELDASKAEYPLDDLVAAGKENLEEWINEKFGEK